MLFHSHFFIFLFLPLTLLGFFAIGATGRHRAAGLWLASASLFFYGWWNPRYLPLIIGSILFNYKMGAWIGRAVEAGQTRRARVFLARGVVGNLGLLGYYKYAHFFVANVATLTGLQWQIGTIALPLAISFFTFTQIAYLVDAWHGRTKDYDLLHYALFVTFFPHLIAGPIVLYRSLMPQFARPETYRFQAENFAAGLNLFICGLAKKVIFADGVSPVANAVFNGAAQGHAPAGMAAWIGAIAYSLQLYFDFSGYSDMAIGIARLFNARFPLNFDSPYQARDIIDFWRRWHITLSTFLRDHLYIPLGGNRKGPIRRYANLFVTMLLGGLWHGAGWTFVIWGGLHGAYLCVNHGWLRVTRERAWAKSTAACLIGRLVTLLAIVVGWVFFRAASFGVAISMLKGMAGLRGFAGGAPAKTGELMLLAGTALVALFAPNSQRLFGVGLPPKETGEVRQPLWRWTPPAAIVAALVFVASVLHLSRISDFLYFQF